MSTQSQVRDLRKIVIALGEAQKLIDRQVFELQILGYGGSLFESSLREISEDLRNSFSIGIPLVDPPFWPQPRIGD